MSCCSSSTVVIYILLGYMITYTLFIFIIFVLSVLLYEWMEKKSVNESDFFGKCKKPA